MSGLVALITTRPDRAKLGREALALLRHLPSHKVVELQGPGVWLGATGRDGTCFAASAAQRAPGPAPADGPADTRASAGSRGRGAVAAVVCGTIVGAPALGRELGVDATNLAALVLAAYERGGLHGLQHLDGAYAYALLLQSGEGTRLLAGGDPCAVMRVTAVDLGRDSMLATEAKAFLAHPSFTAALDEEAAVQLLYLGYLLDGRSPFAGALATTLGTVLDVRDGHTRMRRLWDVRDDLGATSGRAYLESIAHAMVGIGRDVFAGDDRRTAPSGIVLPLTGGLDSRLLAAATPPGARPDAFTFGDGRSDDVVLARRIADARGFSHVAVPFDAGYLTRTAAATVWLSEGRLNPTANLTGFLMNGFAARTAFVSGVGGEIGRHLGKTRLMWPDQALLHAEGDTFVRLFLNRMRASTLGTQATERLLGPVLHRHLAGFEEEFSRILAQTDGLHPIDRVDVYVATQRSPQITVPGLALAELYLGVHAPFFTRRWLTAALAGAPGERRDDLARLRLISMIDARVARIPWTLTHLPLPASESLLGALRGASWAAWRVQRCTRSGRAGSSRSGTSPAAEAAGGCGATDARRAAAGARRAVGRVKELVYDHGERRGDWLRGDSWGFVEDLLLHSNLGERGLIDSATAASLLIAQRKGADNTWIIGALMNLELWHRLFVQRDPSLTNTVREQLAAGALCPPRPR
jgi:hypothetical protein